MTEVVDPVRRYLGRAVERGAMPGATWWIETANTPRTRGAVGLSSREPHDEPAQDDTVYDLASLTKPLATALLAALLESSGALDLEAPIETWAPELRDSAWAEPTLLDLGTHRAGLPAWEPLYEAGRSEREYLRAIAGLPPAVRRGEVLYSDLGYILLGIAVERAAGADLATLFERRVAAPLGLRRTGFASRLHDVTDFAPTERGNFYEARLAGGRTAGPPLRTYLLRGEVHDGNAFGLGGVAGHAGLFGSAGEVARIVREVLARPSRIPGWTERARERLVLESPAGSGRTFGCTAARASAAARGALPDTAPGHVGFTGTSWWAVPDEDSVFVLLTNRVHPVVGDVDFQAVRWGFHCEALALCRAKPSPGL